MRSKRNRSAGEQRAPGLGGFAVLVFACSGDPAADPSGQVTVRVDTVAGVEYVRSRGAAPRWTLTVDASLGSAGGLGAPAADEFAWVSSISLGPDALLYVSDMHNHRILAFDTTGALRATIGRRGKGPGEFEEVFSLAWMGDTLLAFDPAIGRVSLLSPRGEWIDAWPAAGRRLVASPVTLRLYQVGAREVYQWVYRPGREGVEALWKRRTTAHQPDEWRQFVPAAPRPFPDKVVCDLNRGFSWFDHPYVPRGFEHPAPGNRAWVATSDAYRIALRDSAGDTVRVVERAVAAPVLSEEQWSETKARFAAWLRDKTPARCTPRSLERPERKPAFESLMVDVVGRLWVERNVEHGTLWEIFDDGGRLIAAVAGFAHDRQRTVPWLGPDRVAWVTRDSHDVPRVHLARLATGRDR